MEIMKKKWTGERLETFIQTRDTIDHLHRYAIVSKFINGKVVLDIACGEGYGSNLMSEKAQFVYGVDIDIETITNAQKKYQKKSIEFRVGSADAIPIADSSIDVVVSFETIEHHDKHEEMMLEVKRVLKKHGVLIISTPDKLFYSDKRNFQNKFHIKELYKNEFLHLISSHFKEVQLLNQTFVNGNSLIFDDNILDSLNLYTGDFSISREEEVIPMYLITISSDLVTETQGFSVFNGEMIEREQIKNAIQSSNSFKVGSFILSPLKLIKRILRSSSFSS